MEFQLRPWQKKDAASVATYANNPKVSAYLRNSFPYPYTLADAKDYVYFCMNVEPLKQLSRAIVVDGVAVGSISLFLQNDICCKNAEIGYWLGEPFWGHGIMEEAVKLICRYGFNHYDIVRIFAQVFAANIASYRLLEKNGFQREGVLRQAFYKNGRYCDGYLYSILADEISFLGGEQ